MPFTLHRQKRETDICLRKSKHGQSNVLSTKSLKHDHENLNFHPLQVVSRYRDPQLQVGENWASPFNRSRTVKHGAM